jgi:predicted acetyltransferase
VGAVHHLVLIDGQGHLGRIALRHRLTGRLREISGHIGYNVQPTAPRGHVTRHRSGGAAARPHHRPRPALVTCDVAILASRKVIQQTVASWKMSATEG